MGNTNGWARFCPGEGRGVRGNPHISGKFQKIPSPRPTFPPLMKIQGVPLKKKWQKKTEEKISRTYTSDQEKGWEKSQMFKNYLKLIPS